MCMVSPELSPELSTLMYDSTSLQKDVYGVPGTLPRNSYRKMCMVSPELSP